MRVGLISLGCAKNLVDAEIMLGSLLKHGVEITNDAATADALIVNTCSFIDSAQEESVDTILESVELRDANRRGQAVIVSGCLPQRFREELPRLLPEVDAFMGIDQVAQVGEIVGRAVANRTEKTGNQSQVQSPKSKVISRLNKLEKKRDVSGHEKEEFLRGTDKFGKTKTVITPSKPSSILNPPSSPIMEVHQRPTFIPDFATPRFRLTPRHFAYLKIAEGCNHPCSFCIIPRMRGSHRSRTQADIVAEAKALIADGVREINLISQDSTYYGLDLRPAYSGTGVSPVSSDPQKPNHTGGTPVPLPRPSRAISSPEKFSATVKSLPADATTICTLLRELNSLKGDFWIRLLYTHPAHWTDELIQTIAECKKVARYVDMPLQHIHENMLERMRRETSRQYIVDLIKQIRAGVPGIALRTTFIVGFPGETETSFNIAARFHPRNEIRAARRVCVFQGRRHPRRRDGRTNFRQGEAKAPRTGDGRAAQNRRASFRIFCWPRNQSPRRRQGGRKAVQQANVSSWEHGLLREAEIQNSKFKIQNYLVGRGEADAPDIDGRVYVRGELPIGEFARVKIIGHTDYDLIAEPVHHPR